MTYEECEQLVSAFENATLLARELPDTSNEKRMAGDCADAIGEFNHTGGWRPKAIAAWNTRTTHGTLTAEQVREQADELRDKAKLLRGHADGLKAPYVIPSTKELMALTMLDSATRMDEAADTIISLRDRLQDAELGSGTCRAELNGMSSLNGFFDGGSE